LAGGRKGIGSPLRLEIQEGLGHKKVLIGRNGEFGVIRRIFKGTGRMEGLRIVI